MRQVFLVAGRFAAGGAGAGLRRGRSTVPRRPVGAGGCQPDGGRIFSLGVSTGGRQSAGRTNRPGGRGQPTGNLGAAHVCPRWGSGPYPHRVFRAFADPGASLAVGIRRADRDRHQGEVRRQRGDRSHASGRGRQHAGRRRIHAGTRLPGHPGRLRNAGPDSPGNAGQGGPPVPLPGRPVDRHVGPGAHHHLQH